MMSEYHQYLYLRNTVSTTYNGLLKSKDALIQPVLKIIF